MQIESGQKKPPTLEKCRALAKILQLTKHEEKKLIDHALAERATPEIQTWVSEQLAVYNVPVISYSNIPKTSFPQLHIDETTEFIHIAEPKGENMFAVRIERSLIAGEFKDGDLVIIDTKQPAAAGEHVLIFDGDHRIVKLNSKAEAPGEIIGKVWAKYKKY